MGMICITMSVFLICVMQCSYNYYLIILLNLLQISIQMLWMYFNATINNCNTYIRLISIDTQIVDIFIKKTLTLKIIVLTSVGHDY